MQYLKKHTKANHDELVKYIVRCIESLTKEKMNTSSIEMQSLKRRIYDTINVLDGIGLLAKVESQSNDDKRASKILKWTGFNNFWEVNQERKEEMEQLTAYNSYVIII